MWIPVFVAYISFILGVLAQDQDLVIRVNEGERLELNVAFPNNPDVTKCEWRNKDGVTIENDNNYEMLIDGGRCKLVIFHVSFEKDNGKWTTTTTNAEHKHTHIKVLKKCPLKGLVPIDDRCYLLSQQPATWYEAKKNCSQMHPTAYLAQFETHQETVNVLSYLTGKFALDRYWWLGGDDFEKIDDFKWIVGKGKVANEDWCPKIEPDNLQNQRCVHIDVDNGKTRFCLGNFVCDASTYEGKPFHYICEMEANDL